MPNYKFLISKPKNIRNSSLDIGNSESGIILIGAMVTMVFLMVVTLAIIEFSTNHYASVRRSKATLDALSAAEAGADAFVYNINTNNSYSGTGGAITLYSDTKSKISYESTVANGSITNEKVVTVTGKAFLPATATTPLVTRKIKIVIEGTQKQGYAVISGAGGLIMSNNAVIGGLVYINGKISLSNSATIGTAAQPATVNVAYNNCPSPADSTYPQLCTSGQPISIINTAHIYGDVTANNQTTGTAMTNSGLVGSSGVDALPMPDYDRAAQKAAVSGTMTAANASCSSGTKTWPANTHITGGNVLISNACTVTVNGNIWIDGNFTIQNNAVLNAADSVTAAPVVMIDGSAGGKFDNNAVLSSSSAGWGFKFISFYSKAACSPDCTSVTGTDLANSQGVTTLTMQNSGLGANSLFYARWSKVFVNNNGAVGGINGQTIQLQNNGNITFGYSVGGDGQFTWDVRYYEQVFN